MTGKPDLTIPLRLDLDNALRSLQKLKDATDDTGEAMKKPAEAMTDLGDVLAGLATHQGYQALKDVANSLLTSYKETADHIREIAKEFIDLQQALTQVAALQGKSLSDQFTVEQADLAVQAKLKPEEWKNFQEQFQSYGGAYLEGPNRKMSDDDAITFQQYVAEFAKARGINPAEAGQLAGGVLQFAEGPISAAEGVARFGRAFKTLERAATPVSQLLPQMTRLMAQGSSDAEAAQILNLFSEIMPGEEGTYAMAATKGLRNLMLEGKGDELGLTKDMTPLEQMKAASRRLLERQAAGEDVNQMLHGYFKRDEEFRAIAGLMSRGGDPSSAHSGFARVAGYVRNTPANFVETELDNYEKSDGGRRAAMQAEEAWRRLRSGAEFAGVSDLKQEARNQLLAERRFERVEPEDIFRGMASWLIGSKEDQLVRERALQLARQRAAASGVPELDQTGLLMKTGIGLDDATVNEEILRLLQAIEANTKDQAEARKKQPPAPLSAPPPRPQGRT
jgi:hypothetical protein